ncbi:uncharacterized protein LOC127865771 [Dreissena polymorpha]|uniref:uncharacterized protein LOC127865771 n=1 Tax=Dreissena polymorpha TaxID=45954 RepID=UPI002264DB44|nr:uncharacterized protein LOC127865771 [Dreissena polymorpha]
MLRGRLLIPLGVTLLQIGSVAAAAEDGGVIAAAVVSGVLFLCLVIGIAFFCYYKYGGTKRPEKRHQRRHRKDRHVVYNGHAYPPPPPPYYDPRLPPPYAMNGYVKKAPANPPYPSAFVDSPHVTAYSHPPYSTYHGPPPAIMHHERRSVGTVSGPPPPIVIPLGTIPIRADPRPVIHKSKRKKRTGSGEAGEDRKYSTDRRSENVPHEFVVQQSYDGIPIIRPVIYIDDDDDDSRPRARSKSREGRYKKRTNDNQSPKIRELNPDTTEVKATAAEDTEVVIERRPRSRSRTPPPSRDVTSALQSRAMSEADDFNKLRRSTKGAYESDSESSNAPSFRWAHAEPAPEPVEGDVMFFPSGTLVDTQRHDSKTHEPLNTRKDDDYVYTQVIKASTRESVVRKDDTDKDGVYGYTHVIRSSTKNTGEGPKASTRESVVRKDDTDKDGVYGYTHVIRSSTKNTGEEPSRNSPVAVAGPSSAGDEGYEVPIRRSAKGPSYETEHGIGRTGSIGNIGASMSDRLQYLVEDGEKSRFTKYNAGAINFGDDDVDDDEIDPVQLRVKRTETPPTIIPRDSLYSTSSKRPATPPSDIPPSARESTEVPPLILPKSTVVSPREPYSSYRPSTPPNDIPFTPRPPTPPLHFSSNAASSNHTNRPKTPPFDAPETARSGLASQGNVLNRSLAVEPTTGQPGSFQARQRLIEAHLQKNQSGPAPSKPTPSTSAAHRAEPTPVAPKPYVPLVHVTPRGDSTGTTPTAATKVGHAESDFFSPHLCADYNGFYLLSLMYCIYYSAYTKTTHVH